MRAALPSLLFAALLGFHGQVHAQGEALALVVVSGPADQAEVLDAEQLRAQLERELSVAVALVAEAPGAALRIEASSLQAVRVSFGDRERTVDLSSSGAHTIETLALIAANLMRDEASSLLAGLRPTQPLATPAPVPVPVPAPAPAPAPTPAAREPRGCDPTPYERIPFAFNLVPQVGTSSVYGTDVEQRFAVHLVGGAASALRGFELAGAFNYESHAVCGLQIAGGANLVDGPLRGVQIASFNRAGRVDGSQIAFANLATGDVQGAQFGFANIATDELTGLQIGFVNLGTSSMEGVQIGFANIAHGPARGAQLGFLNTAAGDASGLQLGFLNAATRSKGLMLGLLNIAEEADASLGLLNIHSKGRTHVDAWVTDAGLVMAGIEHGGRITHNIAGVGFSIRNKQGVFAFSYGLGARAYDSSSLYVDVDALGYGLLAYNDEQGKPNLGAIFQLRVPIGIRATSAVSFYASPAVSVSVGDDDGNILQDPSLYGVRVTARSSSTLVVLWPGLSLGARFF